MLEALQKGLHRFGDLAATDSDCGSKSNVGALGQLGPGDTVPEFEIVLHQLEEGGISPEPVRTRFGWHIVRLDALAAGQVLPFDVVRPKLTEAMEKAVWTRVARIFTDGPVSTDDISGLDIRSF